MEATIAGKKHNNFLFYLSVFWLRWHLLLQLVLVFGVIFLGIFILSFFSEEVRIVVIGLAGGFFFYFGMYHYVHKASNIDELEAEKILGLTVGETYRSMQMVYTFYLFIQSDNAHTQKHFKAAFIERYDDYTYRFFTKHASHFGTQGMLKKAIEKVKKREDIMPRVQCLNFVTKIATTDKYLEIEELKKLDYLRRQFGLHQKVFDSILARYNYTSEQDELNRKRVKQYASNSLTRYYKILELTEKATEQELKTAYRKLSRIYHPDVTKKQKEFAQQQFILIQDAYEKIKDARGFS